MSPASPIVHMTSLPAVAAGARLAPGHMADVLTGLPVVDVVSFHAEDFMGDGGPPHRLLQQVRRGWPVTFVANGLSIGSDQPPDRDHLARLRAIVDRYQPCQMSAPLAWSACEGVFFLDRLPLPYNPESLARVSRNVETAQRALGMQLLLENPASLLRLESSAIDEADFLRGVVARTGCGLNLDIAGVYISAANHDTEAMTLVDAFPLEHVRAIQLAGVLTRTDEDGSPLLTADGRQPVPEALWAIYRRVLARTGPLPTIIDRGEARLADWAADIVRARSALATESLRRARQLTA